MSGRASTAAWAASANSVASFSVSHLVSSTTPQAPSGPSTTARRSPPQPAAAAVASAAARPRSRAARSPAGTRRTCPGAAPTSQARDASPGRPGASPRSAPRRRCTCRRGGSARSTRASWSNSASTAGQPPAVWMGVTKPKPVVYGKVSVSRRIAGVRSSTAWTFGVAAGGDDLEEFLPGQVGRRPLGHQQRRVAFVDGLRGRACGRSGRGSRPGP